MTPYELVLHYFQIALIYLQITSLRAFELMWLGCNYLRLRYFEWLDLSGVTQVHGIDCVYYTYKGERYLMPIPKSKRTRRFAERHPALEKFFLEYPEDMVKLIGPGNDWHGCAEFLQNELHLYDEDKVPEPDFSYENDTTSTLDGDKVFESMVAPPQNKEAYELFQ